MATNDNIVLHKKSSVENKKPLTTDLQLGELALNTHDGNIYFKKSDNSIAEMKRLDARLDQTDISSIEYANGDISQVTYVTGNILTFEYTDTLLTSVLYYATDGVTHLFTQTLGYDENEFVTSTTWTEAP